MNDNGSLLGDTLVLSGVSMPWVTLPVTSILDMDTDIPGDLCRDPGVMTPLRSARDITMVGTRSVLLRWAVAPGDSILSSPAHGHDVNNGEWCHHADIIQTHSGTADHNHEILNVAVWLMCTVRSRVSLKCVLDSELYKIIQLEQNQWSNWRIRKKERDET